MKFIERQKLTRLEKSIKRQIHQLESSQSTSSNEQQIAELQKQLQSIAIDQLYISFYPTNLKYIALFTGNNGYERVIDIDNKSKLKRKSVWDCIRKSLVDELNQKKKIEIEGVGKEEGEESDGDSSSVPSSDSDDSDSDEEEKTTNNNKKKIQLSNIKSWVNIEAAKQALLNMPEDTYPNATASSSIVGTGQTIPSNTKKNKNVKNEKNKAPIDKSVEKKKDDRFAMSKELDGLFTESTTGEDYQKELIKSKNEEKAGDSSSSSESSDSSDSSDSSSEEEDDADPLKGLESKKKEVMPASSIQQKSAKENDNSSSSSSSSSSSEDSSDSSSSSDSSDSDDEKPTALLSKPNNVPEEDDDESSAAAEEGDDDFFTSNTKISTEDIFTQVQNDKNNKKKNRHSQFDEDDMPFNSNNRVKDKSRGFKSQNQSKREYRAFQSRQKRQKFG